MNKLKAEIGRSKVPGLWPLRERICILFQSLQKGEYFDKNTKEINLLQKDNSNLPFINIILSSKKQDKSNGIMLQEVLVDSGSEICILTEQMLEDLKIPKHLIKKPKQSLNVITSNQILKDCILGSLRLDIWVVLDNMATKLEKCEDTLF